MSFAVADLPWLLATPEDFSAQCKQFAAEDGSGAGAIAQKLASFALNARQSATLAKAMRKRAASGSDFAPLSPFRLGLLAGFTVDLLVDCLPAAAARHGVLLDLVTTPYDQIIQQALDPSSIANTAGLDAALVLVDHRWLQLERPALEGPPAQARIEAAIAQLRGVVEALRANGNLPAIIPTLPLPPQTLFGSYDLRAPASARAMILETNAEFAELAAQTGAYLLDVAGLAERIGTDIWFDPVQWSAYKLPFAAPINPVFADQIGRLLGAIRGKAKKCLVLDLDNTTWGGVIGDDGLEGIRIGQGSAKGEAFLAVQQMALDLRARGVMLAVCSKNDDETARRPFREHPDMLLNESHIAVFQANWLDKPSNLEAIARTLNIGVDALVFLDDNPAERAQVRAALPMVGVPELPNDANWYPRLLSAAGYFETTAFSHEDRLRAADFYASDAQRADVMTKARSLGDYLSALDMTLRATPFDTHGRQRIAQLINKTNQFNLTTRRYTEAEVLAMEADPAVYTLQVRLEDRFGDLGMIAVVIGRQTSHEGQTALDLDTWLMSCRVLGRKVEETMLAEVVADAGKAGIELLLGRYIPTPKNGMVAEFFDKLGFVRVEDLGDGSRRYRLEVADYVRPAVPMRIERGHSADAGSSASAAIAGRAAADALRAG